MLLIAGLRLPYDMSTHRLCAACAPLVLASALTACGGGGGAGSPVSWPYVAPAPGTVAVYAEAFTDNAGNVINLSERDTYASGPDAGTLALNRSDLEAQVIVNGTPWGGYAYDEQLDAAGGRTARALIQGGAPYSCSFSPAEFPVVFPLAPGSTWNTASTATCTNGLVLNYGFTGGSVLGLEDLSLGIGVFHTLHVHYDVSLASNAHAYVQHIAIDRWMDMNSGVDVRIRQAYTYSGGLPPTGYPVSASYDLSSLGKGS